MDSISLDDLVDRLRSVTGHVAAPKASPAAPPRKKIDAASTLVALQALRRHPAIAWLPHTRDERSKGLLEQLRDSCEAAVADTDKANPSFELLRFLNEVADELESERLACVFADTDAVISLCRGELLARLGLDEFPSLSQNLESYPSPWNVFTVLASGPLFENNFEPQEDEPNAFVSPLTCRGKLVVPNATPAVIKSTRRVHADVYDTDAWRALLQAISAFPVSTVRSVWQAALYFFPTSGALVVEYVKREIAAASDLQPIADTTDEDDARLTLKGTLRILNTFFRHLPLVYSTELYEIFFDFLSERVHPDPTSLDALYRACLRRDVGHLPSSTDLWVQYLQWRSSAMPDAARRRDWVKKMYLRILQLPLLQLDHVKESFENFVAGDLKGRFAFGEKIELEKGFVRAKAEAAEIERLMAPLSSSGPGYRGPVVPPLQQVHLPRPLSTFDGGVSVSPEVHREMVLWTSWHTLLDRVDRPLWGSTGSDLLHYGRCRSFLTMRACLFPHQLDSWTDLVHFCLHRQPAMSEKDSESLARQSLGLSLLFMTSKSSRWVMQLFAAHVYADYFHQHDMASLVFKDALLGCRTALLKFISGEKVSVPRRAVLQSLESITVLAVNWMRQGQDRFHITLVARFVMHHVDFLSLTMAVIKKLLKSGSLEEPSAFFRPFNAFCRSWIRLELVRNRSEAIALTVLTAWKEHLVMMIRSAGGKRWNLLMCGVDELFFASCSELCAANSAECSVEAVVSVLLDVEQAAADAALPDCELLTYLVRLRRNLWACLSTGVDGNGLEPYPAVATDGHIVAVGVVGSRLDTHVFTTDVLSKAQERLLREEADGSAESEPEQDDTAADILTLVDGLDDRPNGKESRHSIGEFSTSIASPDESSWSAAHHGRGSDAPHRPFPPRTFSHDRRPVPTQPYRRRPWAERGAEPPQRLPTAAPAASAPQPPAAARTLKRSRSLMAESRPLYLDLSAADYLKRLEIANDQTHPTAGAAAARQGSRRLPPLGSAERLIQALPLISQYDPHNMVGDSISTDWVLRLLGKQETIAVAEPEQEPGH